MKLKNLKPVKIPDDAPFDFEDEDNHFTELKINPKKPYTEKQITAAIKVLYKMLNKQSESYGKGKKTKLFKAGIVAEGVSDLSQSQLATFNQKAGELINHLASVHDEQAIKLLTELVSLMYQGEENCEPECSTDDACGNPVEIPLGNKFPTISSFINPEKSTFNMKFESKLMESEDDNTHHDKQTPRASAYGGVLMRTVERKDGTTYDQILLREVSNHFGGYVWTYAKGRQDPGDTPTQTALREVMEETGYNARIVKLLKDEKDQVSMFGGDTSTTVFYLMHPKGDESCKPAAKFGWETQQIKWVSKEEASKMIQLTTSSTGKRRDAQILLNAFAVYHPTPDSTYLEIDLDEELDESFTPLSNEVLNEGFMDSVKTLGKIGKYIVDNQGKKGELTDTTIFGNVKTLRGTLYDRCSSVISKIQTAGKIGKLHQSTDVVSTATAVGVINMFQKLVVGIAGVSPKSIDSLAVDLSRYTMWDVVRLNLANIVVSSIDDFISDQSIDIISSFLLAATNPIIGVLNGVKNAADLIERAKLGIAATKSISSIINKAKEKISP